MEKNLSLALVSGKTVSGSAVKIKSESEKKFNKVELFNLKKIKIKIGKKVDVIGNGHSLLDYDIAYLRGSYKHAKLLYSVSNLLKQKCYLPISPEAFLICHDKFLTLLKLIEHSLPIPDTYFIYNPETAKEIVKKLNFPIVIKLPEGSHGKGVVFADSSESYKSIIDALIKTTHLPLIIEEYIGEYKASDIRIFVIGEEIYGIKRIAKQEELRANIHVGAKAVPIELDYDLKAIAMKIKNIFNIDIFAVDVLKTGIKTGVIEINLSPGIEGINNTLKINMAEKIANFLFKKGMEIKVNKEKIKLDIEKKTVNFKEFVCNLDIKAGIIKLPKLITKVSKFLPNDEVKIKTEKGFIKIEKI